MSNSKPTKEQTTSAIWKIISYVIAVLSGLFTGTQIPM